MMNFKKGRAVIPTDHDRLVEFRNNFRKLVLEEVWRNNDDADRAEYVVMELVNNAREHGNREQKEKKIKLHWEDQGKGFRFQVADEGCGFSLRKPLKAPLSNSRRGWGLWSIQPDIEDICVDSSKVCVTIKKEFQK